MGSTVLGCIWQNDNFQADGRVTEQRRGSQRITAHKHCLHSSIRARCRPDPWMYNPRGPQFNGHPGDFIIQWFYLVFSHSIKHRIGNWRLHVGHMSVRHHRMMSNTHCVNLTLHVLCFSRLSSSLCPLSPFCVFSPQFLVCPRVFFSTLQLLGIKIEPTGSVVSLKAHGSWYPC